MKQIFVNLPVSNLKRSIAFFEALGYQFNPQFTDDNAACMVIADNIFAMLLIKPFFAGFTSKPISDAHSSTEVLIALNLENRDAVDALVRKAIAAGAKTPMPAKDLGFMYQHGFEDLDGHLWEVFYMDEAAIPKN